MKILEVSYGCPSMEDPLNGIFQLDQALALNKNGNDVIFVAIDARSIRHWRKWGVYKHSIETMPVLEFNVPIGPVFPRLRTRICEVGFKKLLRIIKSDYWVPDIIHVHFYGTARCIYKICLQQKIPYVITEHSSVINREGIPQKKIDELAAVYKNASAVIAVSSVLAKRIKQYSNVYSVIIPNIVDLSKFNVKKIEHSTFRFISACNLKNGKGIDILLTAFYRCISSGMDAMLLIMGDGPERKNIEKQIREYHLEDCVEMFGAFLREQFALELAKSDVFVLPSRSETFGVVYVEAMACGTPVIATRCGGPEDFIDYSNGVLVEVDVVDELVNALWDMYENIKRYDTAKIGFVAKEKYNSVTIAKKVEKTLKCAMIP